MSDETTPPTAEELVAWETLAPLFDLAVYRGHHALNCAWMHEQPCDCGYREAKRFAETGLARLLAALTAERERLDYLNATMGETIRVTDEFGDPEDDGPGLRWEYGNRAYADIRNAIDAARTREDQ